MQDGSAVRCSGKSTKHLLRPGDLRGQGAVKPVIESYSFDKIGEAVSKLKSGKVAGRCVVHFDQ